MRLPAELYGQLLRDLLAEGTPVITTVHGASMAPFIPDGATVRIVPVSAGEAAVGQVVVRSWGGGRLLCHRLSARRGERVQTWGDACFEPDGWGAATEIIGRVEAIQAGEQWRRVVERPPWRMCWRTVKRRLRQWLRLVQPPGPPPCEPDQGVA